MAQLATIMESLVQIVDFLHTLGELYINPSRKRFLLDQHPLLLVVGHISLKKHLSILHTFDKHIVYTICCTVDIFIFGQWRRDFGQNYQKNLNQIEEICPQTTWNQKKLPKKLEFSRQRGRTVTKIIPPPPKKKKIYSTISTVQYSFFKVRLLRKFKTSALTFKEKKTRIEKNPRPPKLIDGNWQL